MKITWPGSDIPKIQNNLTMQSQVAALVQEMVKNKYTNKFYGPNEIRLHVLTKEDVVWPAVRIWKRYVSIYGEVICHMGTIFSQKSESRSRYVIQLATNLCCMHASSSVLKYSASERGIHPTPPSLPGYALDLPSTNYTSLFIAAYVA